MKLLLVDDDSFLRDMYATKFTECGDDVSVAASGSEALSLLKEQSFDVVVMDMVMPGMSGLDLLRQVRLEPNANGSKYIILSNQGEQSDITAATELGAHGYIIKAESIPSEVVEKVHALMK